MRPLFAFEVVTADGFYEGPDGEFDWPNVDDEFNRFGIEQLQTIDILLFGRTTYQMMASYWPTPMARNDDPEVAILMNDIRKIVFSTTLGEATWTNTRLIAGDAVGHVTALKSEPGRNLAIFGSFDLTTSLLEAGLIDELRLMIHPVLLGRGKPMFTGLGNRVGLELLRTTAFESGNVMLYYRPRPLS